MSTPKILHPTFKIIQPSNGKELNFRRYLVKEEKVLLFAKQSKDINDIFKAIKDVVGICSQDEDFNVNEIPLFDLEFIFLKLRAASVDNLESFSIVDNDDQKEYKLEVNFDDIKVNFKENAPSKNIKINDIVIVMRYPKASIYDDKDLKERLKINGLFDLMIKCIENVYQNDELIEMTEAELSEFIDNLDVKTFKKIEEFLLSTPSLKYTVKYINSNGKERELTFNSLMDFFLYL